MIDNYCTGSGGFIGGRLLSRLEGSTVSIPHQEIYGYHLREYSKFFFLSTYGNMSDHIDVSQVLRANISDVQYILTETLKQRFVPDLFLFLSSSSVNLRVQTFYSRAKKAAELIIESVSIPHCIVRPFSITGVGEQKQHLIPTLIRSCFEGTEMSFVPSATHDFVDIDDVIDGILLLANRKATGTFELGSGIETTNAEVRELVETACGQKANVKQVAQLREYDNENWYCRKPMKGWKPKKSLALSIAEMVFAYKHERERT